MSKNIAQIYSGNPSTTLSANDLVYSGKSPYGNTNDSAIKYSDLFTQIQANIGTVDINISNGKSIQSTTGNLDTLNFKAYDVDGVAYSTFMSLRSSNTPRLLIAAPTGGIVALSNFGGTFTIDGGVIGSGTPAAATFTTIGATDDITISNGKAIKTGTGAGNQFFLNAYDVDGVTYKTFLALSAGNTPSMSIAAPSGGSLTIDSATLGGNSPVIIAQATSVASISTTTESLSVTQASLVQKDYTTTANAGVTINPSNGHSQAITINQNTTLTLASSPAMNTETEIVVDIIMDGAGGWTVAFANVTWANGVAPSIAQGAGQATYLCFKGTTRGWIGFSNGTSLNYGTYTPTVTNVANVSASTAYPAQYMRVGNVVNVSGRVDVDPTITLTLTQLDLSVPITSNFSNSYEAGGTAAATVTSIEAAGIFARPSTSRVSISWVAVDVTNHEICFTFQYQII